MQYNLRVLPLIPVSLVYLGFQEVPKIYTESSFRGAGTTGAAIPVAQTVRGHQVAFFYKNYTSKVMRSSHELRLRTVFKQFSSNLNLKILSEMLPWFPTLCKNVKKKAFLNSWPSILIFSVMQRIKLFQSMPEFVQLYWLQVIEYPYSDILTKILLPTTIRTSSK